MSSISNDKVKLVLRWSGQAVTNGFKKCGGSPTQKDSAINLFAHNESLLYTTSKWRWKWLFHSVFKKKCINVLEISKRVMIKVFPQ